MNMVKALWGPEKGRLFQVLPDDVDPVLVAEFFAKTKSIFSARDNASEKAKVVLSELAPPFAQDSEDTAPGTDEDSAQGVEGIQVEPEFLYYMSTHEGHSHSDDHVCDENCGEDCAHAHEHDHSQDGDTETGVAITYDDARGGKSGKTFTDDGTGGGGKGKGKNNQVEEEPVAEEPAPAPEEPVAEEPAPAPEEPVAEEPSPTGDYGWIDTNTYISGGDTPDGFNIKLVFYDEWSDAEKLAATNAAELLSDVIIGDVIDYNGIDDIRIDAYNQYIDGGGTILAQGGVIATRGDSLEMVSEGAIRIDSADADNMVSNGSLTDVLTHEMLHAMGFGSGWHYNGLRDDIDGQMRFTGETAISVYESQYAEAAASDGNSHLGVPLDRNGSHWKESVFGTELMTPRLNGDAFFSDLTLAALEDMGYDTIYSEEEADPLLMV